MSDALTPDDVEAQVSTEAKSGPPSAFLFGNGNALFFDAAGQQMTEMQKHGLSGVHEFTDHFPDAPVYWAVWSDDPEKASASEIHPNLLDHIREPTDLSVTDAGEYDNVFVDEEMLASYHPETGEFAVYDPPGSETPKFVIEGDDGS